MVKGLSLGVWGLGFKFRVHATNPKLHGLTNAS